MTEPNVLITFVIAVGVAAVGAVLAVRLKQSPILGFILGGLVIGPHTPGFVGDQQAVGALADVGVILLMFAIGVHISVPQLLKSGRVAILGASIQIIATIAICYAIAHALGMPPLEAMFVGSFISNSSSTVLIKVLEERGEADSSHGRLCLAWLTIQDLSTVILIVVLTAVSTGGNDVLQHVGLSMFKACLFLGVVLAVGPYLLPRLFSRIAALQSRELFLLTAAACALTVAAVATKFDLSVALGAFVAGIVVSESDFAHEILGQITPLRDLFAALFFVSVGMLVDPGFVLRHLPLVLLMMGLIILLKGALSAGLALLLRTPLRTAILAGVALAQAAEFSFLMARLGLSLNAITEETFSLLLAAAAGSIVLAPNLQTLASPVAAWAELKLPEPSYARQPHVLAETAALRGHAIICGYGRVGAIIGDALRRRRFPFVVVEQDYDLVKQLDAEQIRAIFGRADNPKVLEHAGLQRARIVMIAIPDPIAVRRIVDYAREANPELDVVARSHYASEYAALRERGVSEVVLGEMELALEMTRAALHRFGVGNLEIQAFLHRIRLHQGLDVPQSRRSARPRSDTTGKQ